MPEVVAYRLAAWDTPLWVNPNRSPGRYNRPGTGPTQYLSLHPLTPWAEYLRRQGLGSPEELRELGLRVWALRVVLERVRELTYDTAPELGLEPKALVADDWGPCQALGDRCREEPAMPDVLRVPSAALPGTRNLVLFGPRVAAPYLVEPLDEVDIPSAVVADGARPLHTLPPLVRYRGEPHAEYEAWRRGRSFVFDEPPTPLP